PRVLPLVVTGFPEGSSLPTGRVSGTVHERSKFRSDRMDWFFSGARFTPDTKAARSRHHFSSLVGGFSMQLVVTRGKHQGEMIPITEKVFTIGRDETCHLRAHSAEVSRRHAELKLVSGLVLIRDLGSRNGTWVNGQPLTAQQCLRNG